MKDWKKRSLVLMLASVISVTGSFAAENYKNCIMNMEFKSTGSNTVNLVLNTKRLYEGNISPIKRDANTYVIMLPEVDSAAPTPNLSEAGGNIASVEIKKMPYSNGSKGYTRITVKTNGYVTLNTSSALYISKNDNNSYQISEDSAEEDIARERQENESSKENTNKYQNRQQPSYSERRRSEMHYKTEPRPIERKTEEIEQEPKTAEPNTDENLETTESETQNVVVDRPINTSDSNQQKYLLSLLVLFIILTTIYLGVKAQDKLCNVQGEKLDIDLENEDNGKPTRRKKISRAINKLDAAYAKTASMSMKQLYSFPHQPEQQKEEEEELNIVDLDALFKEQVKSSAEKSAEEDEDNEENDALDDFLSGFSFDDTEAIENIESEEEKSGYDENEYESILNNPNLRFSKDDIACFNELLQSEINGDVIRNIDKYAASNPIIPQKKPDEIILANIVSDYAINQSISFNSEDIAALKKLITVEIDPDFVKDLHTNPARVAEMEKEITSQKQKMPNKTEILTLNVKDMLPNLSEELRLHGNKPVESNAKPQTVYFSEGYDVNTLSLDFDLPDLSKEINNKNAYASKPSEAIQIADNSYLNSVNKLTISGLPDLEDVLAHPNKYEDKPKEEVIVDENSLLNSIANVQFKPFDDGTRTFEIINNDLYDEPLASETIPDVTIIKNEFNQFDNFEVANNDEISENASINEYDDFEAIYDNEYFDLDAENTSVESEKEITTDLKTEPYSPEKSENNEFVAKTSQEKTEEFKLNPEEVNPTEKTEEGIKLNSRRERLLRLREKNASETANALLEKLDSIGKRDAELKQRRMQAESKSIQSQATEKKTVAIENANGLVKYILDGVSYDILSSIAINENSGCHLAKSDSKYVVFAYSGSELEIIKEYTELKSEKIQTRLSETLPDGALRYLVRIGINKFVFDVKGDKLNYVMDLC